MIDCAVQDAWAGQMQFYEPGPRPVSGGLGSGGGLVLYFSIDRFAELLDIVRNESPLALWFDSSESLAGLTTLATEQVGEGDVVRMASEKERLGDDEVSD